ncbi:hypothetical protein L0V05_18735 [Tabrizicola sp. J26]|uniref:hypothetical protein n=1 Tax=Alitabrizicola rongguiensis TaxID=2909234 RepID=UPI001F241D64|nr:hypothetical protein [Tabrizicola rongguiensis]MCF1710849.1 hypothetical protein [Tabrizicola rongguiensis]
MDDLTERDTGPSVGTDAVSELLPLLQSDEWQKRLEAARQQRERILAERGPAPELPPRPQMPRLEVVGAAPLVADPLPRIEPLSGLRAGPVPRTDLFPTEEEEFEEFDDVSAPPPRPLPGLRAVPPLRAELQPATRPVPAAKAASPVVQVAPVVAASAPPAEPGAQKSWLTAGKIAGGFALGIAIGLGFSLSSLIAGWLTTSPAPDVAVPASSSSASAPASVAPAASAGQQPGADSAALPQPHAGTVPATPGILTGSIPDSEPQLPAATVRPASPSEPGKSVAAASEAPPLIAPPTTLASVPDPGTVLPPAAPSADEPAVQLAVPVALSPLLGPTVLGVAHQPDAAPLSSTGPDAIMAATDLTSLASLAPPEISARLPGPGLISARLVAPLTGGVPSQDQALSAPEGPPAPAPVEVQVFIPAGMREATTQETTGRIASAGFVVAKAHPVDVTIKTTHVRYYHEQDRLLAERLAEASGGKARSFIGTNDAPALGMVELWLAGTPEAPVVAKKPAAAKPAKAAKPKKQQTAAAKPAAPKPAASDPIQAKKSAIAEKFSLEKFN